MRQSERRKLVPAVDLTSDLLLRKSIEQAAINEYSYRSDQVRKERSYDGRGEMKLVFNNKKERKAYRDLKISITPLCRVLLFACAHISSYLPK